jgi:hypothetical protein
VLKLFPNVLSKITLPSTVIAVSGSNGKTSTVEMIAHILREHGKTVAWNKEGSNQIEGVTTFLLNNCTLSGKVKADLKGHELPMDNPSSAYRRFDVGMGFEAGVLIHEVAVLKLGLDWGLINKNKNRTVADYLVTHRNTFHLGIGVRF